MSRYETKSGFFAEPGTVIGTKFELIRSIGSGGISKVWLAQHLYGDFRCALKFLNVGPSAFKYGKNEFSILNQIYHPYIVRTFDMDEIQGTDQAYISMEYIPGKSFKEVIEAKEKIDPRKVFKYLKQLVSALQYLKAMMVKHKDIKPGNIMFDRDRCVLIDFNISLEEDFSIGTVAYKCPNVEADMRWSYFADSWALALSFYEILTLKEVFDVKTTFEIELVDACPEGFPSSVFQQLKNIIQNKNIDVENTSYKDYKKLFGIIDESDGYTEIPPMLIEKYLTTSQNQQFLVLHMMNYPDITQPKSKSVIAREALRNAGLPAGKGHMSKLRPVFSQLKAKGVLEYSGKSGNKAKLTNAFVQDLNSNH